MNYLQTFEGFEGVKKTKKIKKHWRVIHAIDDNPAVLKLWYEYGIPTTKIGHWDGSR